MNTFVKNSCPNCGGSLRSWKCDCKPIWSGYTTSDTERASTASAITNEQIEEGREAIDYLHRHGFRKCDIAACNCGSWHGGNASNRLSEISYALSSVGLGNRGKTLLQEIELLIEEHEAALIAPTAQPTGQTVSREDFEKMSGDLTRAKNLLVRLYDRHPEARAQIAASTGSWFVWGVDRDAAISRPSQQGTK